MKKITSLKANIRLIQMRSIKNQFKSVLTVLCFLPFATYAQAVFDVKKIPVTLTQEADAVIRLDEIIFTIGGMDHARKERRLVVTILNERGENKYSDFKQEYDKLNKLKKIEGIKYNASGEVIAKLKNSEIKDVGLSSFGTDISDARIKVADLSKVRSPYPYTIEYSYELETQNMMFYPVWYPYDEEFTSVEKSSLVIIAPDNFLFRYKELNGVPAVVITKQESKNVFSWQLQNLPAYESEPNSPPFDKPFVITAPIEFEVEGYRGSIHSWADVGKFFYELNEGRDELPEHIKAKIKTIIQNEKDPRAKVEKLYEYLQSVTHYMNISLGIGGWQTIPAKEVAAKGYGDCKALSNYMKAILKEAGIPAYQALVYAGYNASYNYSDFPCMHFNHVITCVPLEKDTLFLECTSQTIPPGYQGSFTGNRRTLLLLPENGKLMNTTQYKPTDNAQLRKGRISINEDDNAVAEITTVYTGIQQESRSTVVHNMNNEEQEKWMISHINIPGFDLQEFSFSEKRQRLPQLEEKLKLIVKKAVTKSGTRLFLSPNLMTTFIPVPLLEKERKADLFLNPNSFDFHDSDTLMYELPKEYVLEYLPEPVKITSKFGEYSTQSIIKEGNLVYYRNVNIQSGTYPKSDYKEWADFIKKIVKSDKNNVVFTLKK